jgi:hypothetical protein
MVCFVATISVHAGSLREVPFDSGRWQVQAQESRVEEHLGRTSLYVKNGMAWVEEFYVRPHQSGNPDANQYTPAFHGLTSWQLYHGPGYGAPTEYKNDEWNRVRVVVSGNQAEVFVNDMNTPALFILDQTRAIAAGHVGLNANMAPAHFSSFRFQAGDPPPFVSEPVELPAVEDAIEAWSVSDAFDWATLQGSVELPEAASNGRTWRTLRSESSGLANLGQVNPRGEGKNTAFARVVLESPRDQTARLKIGYSDVVRVYLNGRALYAGDNRYRTRDYRYLGTIGYFDEVFRPLRKGKNPLWLAVAENFGGWGVQATLHDADGVVVEVPGR